MLKGEILTQLLLCEISIIEEEAMAAKVVSNDLIFKLIGFRSVFTWGIAAIEMKRNKELRYQRKCRFGHPLPYAPTLIQ